MAIYAFDGMTDAQGAAFTPATDIVVFNTYPETAGSIQAVFGSSTVTLSSLLTGKSVTFGPGAFGVSDWDFWDSSTLLIGTAGADVFSAGGANDHLYGWTGADVLSGGGGADTLVGGAGADTLTGGAGSDLFVIGAGESGTTQNQTDVITDWSSSDKLSIGGLTAGASTYLEIAEGSYASAVASAKAGILGGMTIVAVQVGGDVVVFADSTGSHTTFEDVVVLSGKTLADVSAGNFTTQIPLPSPPPPPPPPPPPSTTPTNGDDTLTGTAATDVFLGLDGNDKLIGLDGGDRLSGDNGADTLDGGAGSDTLTGGAGRDQIFGGAGADVIEVGLRQSGVTATTADLIMDWSSSDKLHFAGLTTNSLLIKGAGSDFGSALANANFQIAHGAADMVAIQVGADVALFVDSGGDDGFADDLVILVGANTNDLSAANFIVAFAPAPEGPTAGNDVLTVNGALGEVHAGAGDDSISATGSSSTYLRGDDGNDVITGGLTFDDINGNMGNDTAHGGLGDDWVVGGKDQDALFGDEGADIVYGNLGDDSCDGGVGADLIRGGQGNDTVSGGDGDDWLSGDRGDDTISGGAGADIFHTFGDAGVDRVTDFSVAQGDKVQLDPGTQWTVAQVGADTVISMTGGATMVLVGVQMSSLPTGWIFGA